MPPPSNPTRAVAFANAGSRRGRQWFEGAAALLREKGVELQEAAIFSDPESIRKHVHSAIQRGVPLVVVGGGDGTMSLVARHFVGSDSVLGVLPLGTGNALARDLEIPSRIEDACEIIAHGATAKIDLGYAAGDYFVNVATVGLSVRIATGLTDEAKKRLGRAAYAIALFRGLLTVRPFHAVLTTPEGILDFDTLQVVIGNGRYHAGRFILGPDASITEGKLSIYGLATTNRADLFKLAWALERGKQCEMPQVHSISTVGGRLVATPKRRVVIDGEMATTTPLDFKIMPGALRARVPHTFKAL